MDIKLSDDEIVKALEHCTKSRCDDESTGDCPLKNDESCSTILAINALDLIHSQKAEIERLTEENEYLDMCGKQFFADSQSLQVQVDELKANQVIECHGMLKGCDMVKQAVKDTAKEIFTEIKEDFVFNFKGSEDYKKGFCDALEQYDKQLRDLAKQKGVEVE